MLFNSSVGLKMYDFFLQSRKFKMNRKILLTHFVAIQLELSMCLWRMKRSDPAAAPTRTIGEKRRPRMSTPTS
jgi:hypothetical protein